MKLIAVLVCLAAMGVVRGEGLRQVLAAWSVEGEVAAELPPEWQSAKVYDLQGNQLPNPLKSNQLKLSETPIYFVSAR